MHATVQGTHGGTRPGAGRPKSKYKKDAPHRRRPPLNAQHPVHVVLRVQSWRELRTREQYRVIRKVIASYLGNPKFRIVHVSIQNTHLHLIVEATNRKALTWGMQSFAIKAARALNIEWASSGKVFEFRYHATQITTPRQARNAISYVLNNWRRHRMDFQHGQSIEFPVDPYSSGWTFNGWTKRLELVAPAGYEPFATSPPTTNLLSSNYRLHGKIDPYETPGPLW